MNFVLEALEEHHVGVDGDTDRNDEARHAGERQHTVVEPRDKRRDAVDQRARDTQTEQNHNRYAPVVGEHEGQHQRNADGARNECRTQRVLTKRR